MGTAKVDIFCLLRNRFDFWWEVRKQNTVAGIIFEFKSRYFDIAKDTWDKIAEDHGFKAANAAIGQLTVEAWKLLNELEEAKNDPNGLRARNWAMALIDSFRDSSRNRRITS